MSGLTLQDNILPILIRFLKHKIAMTVDNQLNMLPIEMYNRNFITVQ